MWHVTSQTKIMKKIYQNKTINQEQNTIADKKLRTIYLSI